MKAFTMKRFASVLILGAAFLTGCEAPPPESVQRGYRGTGMEALYNPDT